MGRELRHMLLSPSACDYSDLCQCEKFVKNTPLRVSTARCIFNSLLRVSSGDETLVLMIYYIPVDNAVVFPSILHRWKVIYPADSAIECLMETEAPFPIFWDLFV